jgi:hypothetical protein
MIIEVLNGVSFGLLLLAMLSGVASVCVQSARTRRRVLTATAVLHFGLLICELWLLSLGAGSRWLAALLVGSTCACALFAALFAALERR